MGHLSDQIRAALAEDTSEGAIQFRGEWRTWGEVNAIVAGLDQAFAALGLGQGAAIACALRNRPEHLAAMMGIVSGERCLVTLNGLLPDEKLSADVIAARTSVVVASREDWSRPALRDAAIEIGAAGVSLTGDRARPVELVAGLTTIGPGPHQAPLPGMAILMLTSGTTGTPKRVPLRMSVLERQLVEAFGAARPATASDRLRPAAPSIQHASVVHIGGVWGVLGSAMGRRPICLLEKFNVAEWRQAVVEHRPLSGGAPPAALRMILDANIPREDLSSLTSLGAGTAPLDPDIVDEFLARYDLPVLSNYGATEFAGGVASWSLRAFREYWSTKRGSVGRTHKSVEARVVDPNSGEILAHGQEGILELKGFAVAEDDTWVRTTDRAVLDADRFLWIRGRADNAIIRGGFKVHPDEVVAVLEQHPQVREASVVGVADRRLGQVPVAALILRSGALRPSDADLAEWVRARLMAYCVPVRFQIVDDLPRTPSMKVSAPAVRELFAAEERSG
jgi:acyl-CoA synthetase (AMP-forming)/AMP-acid ligase II